MGFLVPYESWKSTLKVGSCPDDENAIQILFWFFLYNIWILLCSQPVAAEKTARFYIEFAFLHFFISFVLEFWF